MILMLFFGVLGWIMERLGWPRPPFILGLVLGNLAETRLFLSVESYGTSWLLRPAVIVIMVLTLAGLIYPFLRSRRQRKVACETIPLKHPDTEINTIKTDSKIRFNWPCVFSLIIIIVFSWALWESRKFPPTARFFPTVTGVPIIIFAIIQFFLDLTGRGTKVEEEDHIIESGCEVKLPKQVINHRTANVFVWIFGWLAGIWLFGFNIGTPLCTFIHLKFGERERWMLSITITIVVWAFVYFIFDRFLHVPFPKGQLFLWAKHLF